MGRLITELADRDGVDSVYRYGPEAPLLDGPDWEGARRILWLHRRLHNDR